MQATKQKGEGNPLLVHHQTRLTLERSFLSSSEKILVLDNSDFSASWRRQSRMAVGFRPL
eukprot:m.145065 g.145065  ORF g.145065 m.145065 type:complete len:60 (+) comp38410_c0_seq4:191-370(+)